MNADDSTTRDQIAPSISRREPRTRSTLEDVARASNTSMKTVSRVFNDEPFVRAATRERVLKAAGELDYYPNIAARSLARQRSFLVGLFYENPSPNYVVDMQMGALDRLHSERFRLLLFPRETLSRTSGSVLALARASGLDGVILAPPVCDEAGVTDELAAAGLPFTMIAPTGEIAGGATLRMDDTAAATEITRHLIALGHRRIGFLHGIRAHKSSGARFEGYEQALRDAGIAREEALIDEGDYTFESGLTGGRRMLAHDPRPTAIFACNDDMAAGVLMAAHEAAIAVPDALSVVGFDDSLISRVVWPRLTTIHQPTYEMAHAAAGTLIGLIDGEPVGAAVTLPYRLLVRGSTAAPRLIDN